MLRHLVLREAHQGPLHTVLHGTHQEPLLGILQEVRRWHLQTFHLIRHPRHHLVIHPKTHLHRFVKEDLHHHQLLTMRMTALLLYQRGVIKAGGVWRKKIKTEMSIVKEGTTEGIRLGTQILILQMCLVIHIIKFPIRIGQIMHS